MNPLDRTIQQVCPTLMVPRYEPLAPMDAAGHRFLAAAKGTYLEIRRSWLHALFLVAPSSIAMPYGSIEPIMHIDVGRMALAGSLHHFINRAREAMPSEHACWLIHNSSSQVVDYFEPVIISRDAGHIRYHRPEATVSAIPFLDAHSHGRLPAFWSPTDNRDDDEDDVKLAFVAGNLDGPTPTVKMRLKGLGLDVDLTEWAWSLLYDEVMPEQPEAPHHDYPELD